jgi:lipoprotein-anchoring transpeptidase ErfK/SrfK
MGFSYRVADRARPGWADLVVTLLIGLAAVMLVIAAIAPARASSRGAGLDFAPGTVVVRQSERRLYFITEDGQAISYPVAVGRPGKQWRGMARIDGKYLHPAWAPPAEVKRAEPWLPAYIPGGSPHNPMGAMALTLSGDQYAIHGTNKPESIGKAASYGCIRMRNADIADLYQRVEIGTPVVVLP